MIEVKKISKDLGTFALNEVSFKIKKGSVVAFVGDNGAGKTTTIKALFGELKLDSGEILLEGQDLFKHENLKKMAFFPDSNNVPLNMKLKDYVSYVCSVNNINSKVAKDRAEQIYNMLDLKPYINKKMKSLSAGWKKRAIMASVLVRAPQYIVFDEPTANVDVEAQRSFNMILEKLVGMGVTIIITSHILEELQDLANYLVLIKDGQIVYEQDFDNKKETIKDIYKRIIGSKTDQKQILVEMYSRARGMKNERK